MIIGKPKDETYYEEQKEVIRQVVVDEEHLNELPIIYNINVGHAKPMGIVPLGIQVELNCEKKSIRFLEAPTIQIFKLDREGDSK